MAGFRVEGVELALHLSWHEEAAVVHGGPRVPLPAVRGVEVPEDAHEPTDHAFKIGERLPGVAEVAAVRSGGRKIFTAVHHDAPWGGWVLLREARYDEWIVGKADPEAVLDWLSLPGWAR